MSQWEDIYRRIDALTCDLRRLVERDPEQEVLGMALPVIDAVLAYARSVLPGDPVVGAVGEVISADNIGLGEPMRAAELLLVASQLREAVYAYRPLPGIA